MGEEQKGCQVLVLDRYMAPVTSTKFQTRFIIHDAMAKEVDKDTFHRDPAAP